MGFTEASGSTPSEGPMPRVLDYVAAHAAAEPNKLALRGKDAQFTYAELLDAVNRHACSLWAQGVRPADRVAFMSAPRPEFVVSYLATTSIGAIWLGLNPRYSTRELKHVLGDADPTLIFSTLPPEEQSALKEAVAAVTRCEVVTIDSWEQLAQPDQEIVEEVHVAVAQAGAAVDTQDPAIIVYTSGSTGEPKGAQLRHSGLVRLGSVQGDIWGLSQPLVLCNLPINHIGCVGDLVGVPLVCGGTLVLRETFEAAEVMQDIETEQISALFQIPTQLQRISAHRDFTTRDLSSLKVVGWGGSPLPRESLAKYRALGVRLVSTYGLTEATCSVTYSDADASDEVLLNTVGRPDPGMNVRLLGEDNSWIEQGEGEVCVKNPTVMAGYLNRAEASAEAFTSDGWLRTGDIGHLREDGNLVLVGRTSDMYKSGGYNIYPREIEQVLEDHELIQLAAVIAHPDPDFHEVGRAFVQLIEGADLGEDAMRAWCRGKLANFKIPKRFIVLEAIPLLPVGKIDKNALRNVSTSKEQTDV